MRDLLDEFGSTIIVVFCTVMALIAIPYFKTALEDTAKNTIIIEDKDYIDDSNASKEKIEFTIDGVNYLYEEGMSWQEWINSSYNTGGYTILYSPCSCKDLLGKNTAKTLINEGE